MQKGVARGNGTGVGSAASAAIDPVAYGRMAAARQTGATISGMGDMVFNSRMENPHSTEQRLMALEVKASFADDLLDSLNETIFRQQQQIDMLTRELVELRKQLPAADGTGFRSLRDELPPHY